MIHFSEAELREIKMEMGGYLGRKKERLANRLGVDRDSIKDKIREIEFKKRLSDLISR